MTSELKRETIKQWIERWLQLPNRGRLAKDPDDSNNCNYVQVIPWPEGKDPYQGWVHYEVIKRDEQWFAEFHVELYKSQGREALEKRLNETLREKEPFMREISSRSYWANRYWGSRRPILIEGDLRDDLDLLKKLVDASGILASNEKTTPNEGDELPVGIKTMTLPEVLALNLQVPNYQRGYCWRMEDVRRMMTDILAWQKKHTSGKYNIGTIVLKGDDDSETNFAIIDGQQRLTTFALFARLQSQDKLGVSELGNFILGENNERQESIGYLVRAREVLRALIGKGKQADLRRVSVNVVRLVPSASDDLAYLFFNHTNSLGRKLTDYELLKGHHLRFVDTENESVDGNAAAEKTVNIWIRLREPLEVAPCGEVKPILRKGEEEVLHKMLFRLRKWGAREAFSPWADDLPTHDLFHHFSSDDESLDGVISSVRAVNYDSIVRDGPEFFNYAETYRWKFTSYLHTSIAGLLYAKMRGHSNDVLFDIINALGFLFYDKFGEKYLAEALYCITYRVSEIRNKGRVMQKYVGAIDIPGISKWAMPSLLSSQINRSNHESILFPMLIDPARDYEISNKLTPTMKTYWASVKELIELLEGKMEITKVKNRANDHLDHLKQILVSQNQEKDN